MCLIDPVGDVYACPFAIHDRFRAGNVLTDGGFDSVWKKAPLFVSCVSRSRPGRAAAADTTTAAVADVWRRSSSPACRSTGPTPSAYEGYGAQALAGKREVPRPSGDHSRRVSLTLTTRPPARLCNESPV